MDKLKRSNSHENIPLSPIATIVHSRPTPHGAGQFSFGAPDDNASISPTAEHIASSPYLSASSATNVTVIKKVILYIILLLIFSYRYSDCYLLSM